MVGAASVMGRRSMTGLRRLVNGGRVPLRGSGMLADVFHNFRTCELATLARDGAPQTWPTIPFHQHVTTTPRPLIDSVVRSLCGREVQRLVRLTGRGMNETYRVALPNDVPVVLRIARHLEPWFT